MQTPNTFFRTVKAATPALFSLALPFLSGALEQASVHFDGLLCALAGELLKYLPSMVLEAGQRLGSYALDHVQLFTCVESLVSLCSFMRLLTGLAGQ